MSNPKVVAVLLIVCEQDSLNDPKETVSDLILAMKNWLEIKFKIEMNVLSLFDGMSCGQIALKQLGIIPEKYYASAAFRFFPLVFVTFR